MEKGKDMKIVIEMPDGTGDEAHIFANSFYMTSQQTTFGSVTTLVIKKVDAEMGRMNQLMPGNEDLPSSVPQAVAKSLENLVLSDT